MSRDIRIFSTPQRVVVGTVGLPGERIFYLQVDQDQSRVWIRVEKQQVATLAEQMQRIVATLMDQGIDVPPMSTRDDRPLDTPIEEDFIASAIGLGWDEDNERVVVELHALGESEPADFGDDDPDAADTVRIELTLPQTASFAERTQAVVAAGRPTCPLCQLPLEPTGHICPRANGYRRHSA